MLANPPHFPMKKGYTAAQLELSEKNAILDFTGSSRVFLEHFSMVMLFARFAMLDQHILV